MSLEEIQRAVVKQYGSGQLTRLSGGYTNGTFLVQGPTPPVVLKVYSQGSVAADNEFGALQALSGSGVTPEVYDRFSLNGVTAIVMEYRVGSNVQQAMLDAGRIADLHQVYEQAGWSLATKVHKHPVPPTHSIQIWDGQATAAAATETNLPFVPAALLSQARASIEQLTKECSACAVTHGDFGPHNLLVGNDQHLSILDWEWAEIAPPVVDVAWLCWFTSLHYAEIATPLCASFLRSYVKQAEQLVTPETLQRAAVYRVVRVLERVRHAAPAVQQEWVRRLEWTLHHRDWPT
jgi:aminoglycoside phosphotransferase (APT) family kinase protein